MARGVHMNAMVQVCLRLMAVAGQADALARALGSIKIRTQLETSGVQCDLWTQADDRGVFCYMETWPRADVLEQHMRSETFAHLLSVMETAAATPALEFRFVSDTRGLEYVAAVLSH